MRVALVGYGTIAQGHLHGYRTAGLRLVGVADVTAARRELARRIERVDVFEGLPQLLSHMQVDVVDICVPPAWHLTCIQSALAAGALVLCEKPFLQAAEFEELGTALSTSAGFVYPAHNYTHSPVALRLTTQAKHGTLGALVSGRSETVRAGHAVGVPEFDPHWRRDPKIGFGGVLQDHGPHSLYSAMRIVDSVPRAVTARVGNLRPGFSETEDTAAVDVTFDNGFELRLDLTWAGSRRVTKYAFYGTGGSVEVSNNAVREFDATGVRHAHLPSDFDDPTHASWFGSLFREFVAASRDESAQAAQLREAGVVARTIDAAYLSAADGTSVAVGNDNLVHL